MGLTYMLIPFLFLLDKEKRDYGDRSLSSNAYR